MNASLLQEFRAMQLAIKGAGMLRSNGKTIFDKLMLDGIDAIELGEHVKVIEICLDTDEVLIETYGGTTTTYLRLSTLSDDVIEDFISIMRAKALEIADRDVLVNSKGEVVC
jgi:hypothetical protein